MIGQSIAHYEITAKLGEGGMGEVYRATDTRLKREVALKILPESFTDDPQRVARFTREAQVLASLSHPHIGGIYGIEEQDGVRALALELVEGEDLSDRIARGPIVLEQILKIALQIAEAVEAAHEKGVVHRDLKPANIKLTSDGQVKVLDFGLAKAMDPVPHAQAPDLSPTLTLQATQAGLILGTAAYMSPEQASGRPADRLSDIWAFGVVLWEMLTRQPLFSGESVAHVLASTINEEPDFEKLPASTPAAIRNLLRRCLRKGPRERKQSMGDVRVELADLIQGRTQEIQHRTQDDASHRLSPVVLVLIAVALLAAGVLVGWALRTPTAATAGPPARWALPLPNPFVIDQYPGAFLGISRDGQSIVYANSGFPLHLRRLDELEIRSLPETDNASQPFFSPDGNWIGFFKDNSLKKVAVSGGRPVTLVENLPNAGWSRGSWSDDGRIVFDTWNAGLRVVSADGGSPLVLTNPRDEWHLGPQVLPDSTQLLYLANTYTSYRIEAIGLDGGPPTLVVENASHPIYLASGHLLFVREGGLMVAPFDVDTLQLKGSAVSVPINTVVDHINLGAPIPQLAVSLNGTLVYAPAGAGFGSPSDIVRVDRQGNSEVLTTVPFPWPHFDVSPDGERLVISGRDGARVRIEILDLSRNTRTPLLSQILDYPANPLWAPDGSGFYFAGFGTHESELLFQPIDGSAQISLGTLEGALLFPRSVSRDGRYVVGPIYHPVTGGDIWYLDHQAPDDAPKLRPLLADDGYQAGGAVSPDGNWLAYYDARPGSRGIYLRQFPNGQSAVKVSESTGWSPRWSGNGRELFYQSFDGSELYGVAVDFSNGLRLGQPQLILEGSYQVDADIGQSYEVMNNGQEFIMVRKNVDYHSAPELIVVLNWFEEIERLVTKNR